MISDAAALFAILATGFFVWYLSYTHYTRELFYPYCKDHKNLRYSKNSKFCSECGKPLYKKELKEIQVK